MQVQADAVVVKLNLQPLADAMQADAADAVAEINARAHLLTSNALGDAASIREGASTRAHTYLPQTRWAMQLP
jgi:hypothetical protein